VGDSLSKNPRMWPAMSSVDENNSIRMTSRTEAAMKYAVVYVHHPPIFRSRFYSILLPCDSARPGVNGLPVNFGSLEL
jgi:hypothetical protein